MKNRYAPRRVLCSGFSLMEVMVVLAILAVTASVAAPALITMAPNQQLKTAARELYSTLQEAKSMAIKQNRYIRTRFNATYYYIDTNNDGSYTLSTTDTFIDANGDGSYNRGESFTDIDGNGVYSGEIAVNVADYGYGVAFGTGNATKNWNSDPCSQASIIPFSSRATSLNRSVYLENRNRDISYAVTVRTTGSLKIRKYNGSLPFNKKNWN